MKRLKSRIDRAIHYLYITRMFGPRCPTTDIEDLGEDMVRGSRCPVCKEWDDYDALWNLGRHAKVI